MQKSEKDIINIIKYLPVILILLISSTLTFFLYNENINRFNLENEKLEEKYISLNKDLIKFQITKIKDMILSEKKQKVETLKASLKTQVDNAYNIAMSIYKNNKDKSEEEIISLIKDALRDIRFNESRGYLFIYQKDGVNILHPVKPELENKNLWSYQDKKGTYLLQEMDRILLNKKETFYSWYWTKPDGTKKEYEKLGFFKVFEPFNWFIGTGEYVYDFEEQLKDKLAQIITDFRYKKDGYVFVLDYKGKYLSYHDKNIIGKNVFDLNMAKDMASTQNEMINLVKTTGGYLSYGHRDKPEVKGEIQKISYIDGIKDWKWIIGTGFYMDDFYKDLSLKKDKLNKQNNDALTKLLIVSVLVTLALLFIFIYLSSVLENKFLSYREDIKKQINDNIKKDNILAHQSKLAAMGEMLGNISHQWRQPLSTVSTIVTGIKAQRELGINDDKLEKDSLDTINKHIQYLSQTIDDFSNFFKPHKEANTFDLSSMINKTMELVEPQLNAKHINLVKEIETCEVYSLENELIQVLINLLNNARDELVKIDDEKNIFIFSEINDENIIIKIKDNAGGVKKDIIDRIFEPYFTTKMKSQGTGIGLFMSEEIIVKHLNGEISVENIEYEFNGKLCKGAEFKIKFPRKHFKTKENLS